MYSKKTPDDGQRNCPKHVELCSKNKSEKLVHLVGFILRIDHDARSPERQIYNSEVCHPRCVFKLYGEVSSVKKHNYKYVAK